MFLEIHGPYLTQLREAITLDDVEGVKKGAHGLKGCLNTVAARYAVGAANILEVIGRDAMYGTGNLARAESAYTALVKEIGRVRRAMTHFLAGRIGSAKEPEKGTRKEREDK
jgi:hypothetical protein